MGGFEVVVNPSDTNIGPAVIISVDEDNVGFSQRSDSTGNSDGKNGCDEFHVFASNSLDAVVDGKVPCLPLDGISDRAGVGSN